MTAFQRSAPLLVGVFLLLGCSAKSEPPPAYAPTASLSQPQAVAVLRRCLEEQPGGYSAINIEVSPTKLTFETGGGRLLRGGGTRTTVFYFDSLGRMDIVKKSKGSVVRVWDNNEVFRFRVVIPDPARARQFMDAMASMAQAVTQH